MEPVISGKDLFKCYSGFAPVLRGANISVEPGEMAAIMGPSGCGKSTMLHILGLLHAPDSGSLSILGQNVLEYDRQKVAEFRRENMGFVMQASNLFDHSTVFENVEFPLIYDKVPPQERWERVIRALELVNLSGRVHYRSNQLSGGEQQRVAIARAMVNQPRILLADEPTGALDARTSRLIMENFRKLCHDGGVSMIMVTHDPAMADFCDSIYTLEEGVLHNRKHVAPALKLNQDSNFLNGSKPRANGALITRYFPPLPDDPAANLAARLNGLGVLSRIYAMRKSGWIDNISGYSLPLPVRRMSAWKKIFSLHMFWRRSHTSCSLWRLWREMPLKSVWAKIKVFSRGVILARWGLTDKIEFFYGADALGAAARAWTAARLLREVFAFSITARDMAKLDNIWEARIRDSLFVTCPSNAIKERVLEKIAGIDSTKIILLRPLAGNAQDDGPKPAQKGKMLEIVAPGIFISKSGYRMAVAACALLKKGKIPFRLNIYGKKSWKQRWLASSIRAEINFLGARDRDSLADIFKTTDIYIACAPDYAGGDLDLPWDLCLALGAGLAVIAAHLTPGMQDVLEPDKNCLCADNAAELAQCLEKLYQDANFRSRLGCAAQETARLALNPEKANQEIVRLIAEAVGREKRKNRFAPDLKPDEKD